MCHPGYCLDMGKRAKKVTLKKMAKPKLETVFSCPLCSHEKCIECRMDRGKQIGTARCRVCTAGYQTVITNLSDPVDVYSEWVDVIAEREKNKSNGKDEQTREEKHETKEDDNKVTSQKESSSEMDLPRHQGSDSSNDLVKADNTKQDDAATSSDDDDDFFPFQEERSSPQKNTIIESDEE